MKSADRRAWAAWAAVCFFWGTGYLAYRIGVRDAPPFLFAGLRILAAGLLVAGWTHARGAALPRRADWATLVWAGILTEGFANGVISWSAQWLSSGLLAILVAMAPFWMVGIEAALPGGERITLRTSLGLLLGFSGLAWMVWPQMAGTAWDSRAVAGCALMQASCVCYAAGSLLARRQQVSVPSVVGAGWQMVFAGAVLTLLGTVAGEWRGFRMDSSAVWAFAWLLFFGSVVGFGSYIYALQRLPLATVSLHRYINPVVALFLGWLVLREPFTLRDLAAVAVIFVGVVVVQGHGGQDSKRGIAEPSSSR